MKRGERGTAVVMAMLVLAAAATLVAGALWQQNALIRESENELQYAQARWLIRGAIDWAGVILREDARTSSVDHAGEPWAVPLADTRLDDTDGRPPAYLAGAIEDEQAKFNLRNLVSAQGVEARELESLGRLLASLRIDEKAAKRIAQRMEDALSAAAQKRPAPGAVAVEELLAVDGVDAAAMERLRPLVTVLPEPTPVNVNTASAEMLASQFRDLTLLDARRVVSERARAYFRDLADARARLAEAGVAAGTDVPLAVSTRYFAIEGYVSYGNARLRARALVKREGNRLDVLWLRELG